MQYLAAAGVGLCALLAAAPATARLTQLAFLSQEPFADGASFGDAGPYVRVRALAHGELDPKDPANAGIALLGQAPRNARGMVEYDTDVFILRPADPARGNGALLYDVTNRGNKLLMSWLNDAPEPPNGSVNDPRTLADAGNAFTFRRGDTMVWSGWQPEVTGANNGMAIRVPVATSNGLGIVQRIRHEFVAGTRGTDPIQRIRLPYPVAHTDTAGLTVRSRQADVPMPLGPDDFRWVDSSVIQLMPFGTTPTPRRIYEFTYEATRPTVDGIGFAATRDLVSHLRAEPGIRRTLAIGVSLSGRFLRHFLELGMNRDEAGRRVFDGVLPHISGAGKVFANEPFAMPFRTATQHEDRFYPEVWPPFGYGPGRSLLRGDGSDPLIIESNTSTEYWQKAASLVHTDATGADVALPPGVRMTLVAGTQHGGHAGSQDTPGYCANPRNPNSAGPALRAMLTNLDAWVAAGTVPPDSMVPRRGDETGVPAAAVHMPAVPGVTWAPGDNPIGRPVDWTNPPAAPVQPYSTMVAAVDADGNEVAGLRLPHLAVPLGTYTGVNVYKDLPSELCDRDGMFIPFARTRADRERTGDPRLSLEERYGTREAYVAKVKAAADALVAGRLLLAEDAARYVAAAAATDRF
jgi:hypothetical protein